MTPLRKLRDDTSKNSNEKLLGLNRTNLTITAIFHVCLCHKSHKSSPCKYMAGTNKHKNALEGATYSEKTTCKSFKTSIAVKSV
jgi:hypothetical protein